MFVLSLLHWQFSLLLNKICFTSASQNCSLAFNNAMGTFKFFRLDQEFFSHLKFEIGQLRFAVSKTEVCRSFKSTREVSSVCKTGKNAISNS